ncbi:hypothetical protein [Stieleria varia]|uniref:PDZ domain-containing protein n=1 Tax=Stieleria varia TaxID=2528005 RepID=A0A5C6B8X4_9BACT|nr:hypothetical protein [Stieleria varia]TWU07716.1 hypothetical protein Pla52n_02890 [Stieleria varia]
MQSKTSENPLMGYVVVAVALIAGSLAASVWGQAPLLGQPNDEEKDPIVLVQSPDEADRPVRDDAQHHHDATRHHEAPLQVAPQTAYQTRWLLGVVAQPTDAGYVIQRTEMESAAEQLAFKPGDRVIAVNGQQIGWIGQKLVPLRETLQHAGGRHGKVRLLIQDCRTARLSAVAVQLRSLGSHLGH